MGPKSKSVAIIGGGLAGLASAVFLDALGYKITLFEKKPILGGRTYAFHDKKTDTFVDNGQHLLMGAYHETFRFLENIGAKHHLQFQKTLDVPLITDKKKKTHFTIPRLPFPFNVLAGLARFRGMKLKDKWSFLKIGKHLEAVQKDNRLDDLDQAVDQWLTQHGQSKKAQTNFWDLLTLAALNVPPNIASARSLACVLQRGFLSSPQDGCMVVPTDNLNELFVKPARAYLEIRGHTLHTGKGIDRVHILDKKVVALDLEGGETFKSDIYISAVPFRHLLKIIPEGFVDTMSYFNLISKLTTSPILSVNLWFDKNIMQESFIGVAEKQIHWYFNRNKIHDITHPPYHITGVTSGATSLLDSTREEIIGLTLNEMKEIFPAMKEANLVHSLVNKEREATFIPEVGSDNWRPSQKSPFANFYVVGDWTNTGLPATIESAVVSARMATNMIEKNHAH